MKRANLWVLGTGVIGVVPAIGTAQISLPSDQEKPKVDMAEVGGKVAFDQLRVRADSPSLPLRYGQVKKGSDRVSVMGRTLERDKEYILDYVAGVVYLKVPLREGTPVTVEYRYDEATGTQGTFGLATTGAKFQGYTFNLTPGTAMVLGMGLTERLGDGTVLSSNVYGLNNAFNFGSGTLKGTFMVGDRQKVTTNNLFGDKAPGAEVETGRSQAIIQTLQSRMLGGKVTLGYQDIGDKFSGFSALQGSGYEPAQIQQFANERGLKRTNFQAEGIGGKALGLAAGMKSVGDDSGTVSWRNYGANIAGFSLKYDSVKVDPGFAKFNQLAEGDRAQLAKERGLDRQSVGIGRKWANGALQYDATKVETLDGFGLYRRAFAFNLPWVKAAFNDQHVQAGFNRFGDLREGDRNQLAREGGLVREATSLALTPKGGPQLNWAADTVRTDAGDLMSRSFGLGYGPLSLSHSRLDIGAGFGALGSLAQPEIGNHLTSIVKMADPAAGVQGPDWQGWANAAGLNRSVWRMNYDLGRGSSFAGTSHTVEGAKDDVSVRQFALSTPKLGINYREQSTGADFSESGKMLLSEQQRLGTAAGLDKSDLSLNWSLSPFRKLAYSRMAADDAGGSLGRQTVALTDKGFAFSYNRRFVDSAFASLPGMVDPERDLLTSLVGFEQADVNGAWQMNKGLSFEYRDSKAFNRDTGLGRFGSLFAFNWKPFASTQLTGSRTEVKQTDPTQPLVDQQIDTMQLTQKMGKLGNLMLLHQEATFDGSQDGNPDSRTDTLVYENQLTKSTSVRTEHSKTIFENGEHETKTSNSLSQALSSRVGVSVTDTRVEREGEKPDETHRDYGFWVDFGKNIRLNYKAVRNLKGETEGELQNDVSVSPGTVQDVTIGSASYQRRGWDDRRDQHVGNVSLANARPLQWGFLRDVRFNYTVDSVRDMELWQREYRTMGFGARIGAFAFGVDYKSQSLPQGDRAIDRVFSFTTDVTGKSKIRGDVKYNVRTLPFGQLATVRDYKITAEPFRNWSVSHSLITNPLQADNNAMLGALATPARSNKWNILYDGDPRTKFNFGYEEYFNEQNNQQVQSLKIGTVLFANNPSPLVLEYIMAETNVSGTMQRSHGFNLAFTQRPGPNQSLAFKISNLNWELARPADQNLQNWNLRLDYSWKF